MSSSDDEHTQRYSNSSLNEARINSPSEIMSTPSTKQFRKRAMKSAEKEEDSSQNDEEWRILLTKSIQQASEQTPAKVEMPTQSVKKQLEKTADIKNKQGCTYENMCPICLNKYDTDRGSLECLHEFCFACISEWCKTSTICPCCRRSFTSILKLTSSPNKADIRKTQRVSVEQKEFVVNTDYDYYTCYQCGLGDNQHVLLICDACDFYCCHVYCDAELSFEIPDGDWFCRYCKESRENENENEETLEESEEEASPEKAVAQRTRSRQSYNLRGHLAALRNIRRR